MLPSTSALPVPTSSRCKIWLGTPRREDKVQIPRCIELVAEFPMTITGKIQKFVMREQTIRKLGLKAEKTA